MNRYVPIFQEYMQKAPYEFGQLLDRDGRLIISVMDGYGNILDVCFNSYLVYRKMDEGDALAALNEMKRTGGTTRTFYRVENSEFVAWFNQQSFDIRTQQHLVHYAVVTANDVVDVVALELPTIEIRN